MKPHSVNINETQEDVSPCDRGESPIAVIHGVGKRHKESFRGIGIETVEELARITDVEGLGEVLGIPVRTLKRIRLGAVSYLNQEIYQTDPFEFPLDHRIYIDIETDVHCRRVWLIGLMMDGHFTQLYADTWDQERDILERFLVLLKENPGHHLVSFSGTNFDIRVTLNACKRQGLDVGIFEAYPHIDLCIILRRCFVLPHSSYALKELGGYLGYPLKQTELDGLAVARAYAQHIESGDPLVGGVLEYNEDDVRLVEFLVNRCFSLRTHIHTVHRGNICVHSGCVFVKTKLDDWLYPHGDTPTAFLVEDPAIIREV